MKMISLTTLKDIVRQSAQLFITDDFSIMEKDGCTNIVTTSDLAVQEFLKEQLSQALPGSGFICEEEDIHTLSSEYTWIIDPIDGTANYARGLHQCAISVGLKDGEGMAMAAVYLPRTDEMFTAQRGYGAWLNDKPIHVSNRTFPNSVMCTALPVYHKNHARECADIITEVFAQCNDIRRLGAAAPELCYLAAGRVEMYFEYKLGAWDYAAASLIVEEAGGVLSDLNGNRLDPTQPSGVLAANTTDSLQRLQQIVVSHLGL